MSVIKRAHAWDLTASIAVSILLSLYATAVAAALPSADFDGATYTAKGAILKGVVSSNGARTTVRFEYGLTDSLGSTRLAVESPLAAEASNAEVSSGEISAGSSCDVYYYFRVVAVNSSGTTASGIGGFHMPCIRLPLTLVSGCTASASATTLPSTGGEVALNANCTSPSSGISYSWTKNSASYSTSQNPTDVVPANMGAETVIHTYRATACLTYFPQSCTVVSPTILVAVAAASAPPAATPSLNQHGFTGSWYEPASSGQGMLLEVFPDLTPGQGQVFIGWFTYDTAAGGAERQRWYTLQGPMVNGQPSAPLTIYQNTGGNFNAPPATTSQAVGTATLRFDSCSSGELSYSFNDGRSGTIPLIRLLPNVTCAVAAPYPTNADFMLSGSWYGGAATSGQGFLADVGPNARFFLAWFTYLPNGAGAGAAGQRWYSAQGPFTPGQRTIPVEIQETTGGSFDSPTPAGQHTVPVGTGTMVFHSCAAATFSYTFTGGSSAGSSGTINLGRIGTMPPGCAP